MPSTQTNHTSPAAITGTAAGVPFLAVPPATTGNDTTPIIVAWHMLDAPRTEAAFAAALPLQGLDAWRIYLGLPLSGARLPEGGIEALMQLGFEDAVLNLHGPISTQAAAEFPTALAALRTRLNLPAAGPLGLVGGSIGAATALLVITEGELHVSAAVLISPLLQLRPAIEAMSRQFGVIYPWSPLSEAIANRLDFVARADAITPAILTIVGADDDQDGFLQPAHAFRDALAARASSPASSPDRAALVSIKGMGHALAEEPGMEPAPQLPTAAEVDRHAVDWFHHHL